MKDVVITSNSFNNEKLMKLTTITRKVSTDYYREHNAIEEFAEDYNVSIGAVSVNYEWGRYILKIFKYEDKE